MFPAKHYSDEQSKHTLLQERLKGSTWRWGELRQDPLEAILVIFSRSSLIFLSLEKFERSWKNMKNDTTLVCMRNIGHLGNAKMSNLTFQWITTDKNGFCRTKEGLIYKTLPQIFNFFPETNLLPVDLSAIQSIGSCETIWNLVFDNPAGKIKNSKCCLQAQLFSMFSWHAEVTGMHAACVARGY